MKRYALALFVFVFVAAMGITVHKLRASDHDDGENDVKSRSLNLTDHYAFRDTVDTTKLNLVQTSNPRSLAGFQYYFSTQGRYEIHVTRVADKKAAVTGADNMTFRFEFAAPDSNTSQAVTFTVLKDGNAVGSDNSAKTIPIAQSKAMAAGSNSGVNSVSVGGVAYKFFVGLREDNFNFDVERFFEVRAFLASTFFGGVDAVTPLTEFQNNHKTCDGKSFLSGIAGYDQIGGGVSASASNADTAHLFNPPSCAPDFTKLYNRNEIELQVPIAALQANGETTFDTWSTISIPQ